MNTDKCAPGIISEANSCISLKILIEMVHAYNNSNPDKKINLYDGMEMINQEKYRKYLLNELSKQIGNKCTSQSCWTSLDFIDKMDNNIKDELQKYTFRPEGPKKQFEWLNTTHINEVMDQYKHKYHDFLFLGAVPIDFDDLEELGIKNLNLKKIENDGIKRIGIIFNLDEHYKSGSHWVAMYSDLSKGEIFYFDSYGLCPELRIRRLAARIAKYIKSKHIQLNPKYNSVRHQFKGSECGVYSINTLVRLLEGESFEHIACSKTPDDIINKFRMEYFNGVSF